MRQSKSQSATSLRRFRSRSEIKSTNTSLSTPILLHPRPFHLLHPQELISKSRRTTCLPVSWVLANRPAKKPHPSCTAKPRSLSDSLKIMPHFHLSLDARAVCLIRRISLLAQDSRGSSIGKSFSQPNLILPPNPLLRILSSSAEHCLTIRLVH